MRADWKTQVSAWADAKTAIEEVWLFGSRAKGNARVDSDLDLCLKLKPSGAVLGLYLARGDEWQRELTALVEWPVSLEAVERGSELELMIHETGCQIYIRA